MRWIRATTLAALLLASAAPATAAGATTFGAPSLAVAPQAGGACPLAADACTTVLAPVAARAPQDGVVVAWSIRAVAADQALTLRAVRPVGGRWQAVATDPSIRTVHGGAVERFAARMPVRAGDALAVEADALPGALDPAASGPLAVLVAPFGDGEPARSADAEQAGGLLLQAELEADQDGDGYGDTSQDACPADRARHALQCTAALSVATAAAAEYAVIGGSAEQTFRIVNAGPSAAPDVRVRLSVPAGARVTAASGPAGPCSAEDAPTCALGELAAGAQAVVTIGVTTDVPGAVQATATVAGAVLDGVPADDSATATTTFTPPSVAPAPSVFATPPCVNVRVGTHDDEVIDGTDFGDRLVGRGGRDLLRGGRAGDCLEGGIGADVLAGGPGDDRLSGGDGADRLYGDDGADRLSGGLRDDTLAGGTGNDVLLPGRGADRVAAGPGDDTVSARDDTRDVIDCGPGRDTARVDRRDRVRRCEVVQRG